MNISNFRAERVVDAHEGIKKSKVVSKAKPHNVPAKEQDALERPVHRPKKSKVAFNPKPRNVSAEEHEHWGKRPNASLIVLRSRALFQKTLVLAMLSSA